MKYFLYMIGALIFVSCTGGISSIYDADYPLTTETAKAKTSSLSVKIPEGWFAAEDNEQKLIDLWLLKDDYSAALNFVAINVDSLTMKEIRNDEIKSIVELSRTFKKAKYGKALSNFTNQEFFEINKKQFAAYEYLNDAKKNIRVVVFKAGNKFYELSAVPVSTENLSELYKIQNSVLSSIRD